MIVGELNLQRARILACKRVLEALEVRHELLKIPLHRGIRRRDCPSKPEIQAPKSVTWGLGSNVFSWKSPEIWQVPDEG
jgi:hypothetical protein